MAWKVMHYEIIKDFMSYLSASAGNKYILKGGTSLMLCYGLTRFSEDIDLDGFDNNFIKYVDNFIKSFSNKYPSISYRVAKNTDTVKRVFIHYGNIKPLKVEVSYRRKQLNTNEVTIINNIVVYNIETILSMKLNAFNHRDKIRDLYDIVFIYTNYKNYINNNLLCMLRDAVEYKGLEQFDYLVKTQKDELIDNDALASSFLAMYYNLGLK